MPPADRVTLDGWFQALLRPADGDPDPGMVAVSASIVGYLGELVAAAHREPDDNLVSVLVFKPRWYAFFLVEPADPGAGDELRRGAALLDYGRGGNRRYDAARLLRDYLVRVEPGSDDLLLGKAFGVLAGRRVWHSYFLIERHRPLRDPDALAARGAGKRT